eukprot:EG_transcript_5003
MQNDLTAIILLLSCSEVILVHGDDLSLPVHLDSKLDLGQKLIATTNTTLAHHLVASSLVASQVQRLTEHGCHVLYDFDIAKPVAFPWADVGLFICNAIGSLTCSQTPADGDGFQQHCPSQLFKTFSGILENLKPSALILVLCDEYKSHCLQELHTLAKPSFPHAKVAPVLANRSAVWMHAFGQCEAALDAVPGTSHWDAQGCLPEELLRATEVAEREPSGPAAVPPTTVRASPPAAELEVAPFMAGSIAGALPERTEASAPEPLLPETGSVGPSSQQSPLIHNAYEGPHPPPSPRRPEPGTLFIFGSDDEDTVLSKGKGKAVVSPHLGQEPPLLALATTAWSVEEQASDQQFDHNLSVLLDMGFDPVAAEHVLRDAEGDLEAAISRLGTRSLQPGGVASPPRPPPQPVPSDNIWGTPPAPLAWWSQPGTPTKAGHPPGPADAGGGWAPAYPPPGRLPPLVPPIPDPGGPQDQPWAAPFTEADVQQLQEMGFGDAARCRAALAASRGDVAAAVGWLMMDPIPALSLTTVSTPPPSCSPMDTPSISPRVPHSLPMLDPDKLAASITRAYPAVQPTSFAPAGPDFTSQLQQLQDMGFPDVVACGTALARSGGNVARAVEWLCFAGEEAAPLDAVAGSPAGAVARQRVAHWCEAEGGQEDVWEEWSYQPRRFSAPAAPPTTLPSQRAKVIVDHWWDCDTPDDVEPLSPGGST